MCVCGGGGGGGGGFFFYFFIFLIGGGGGGTYVYARLWSVRCDTFCLCQYI